MLLPPRRALRAPVRARAIRTAAKVTGTRAAAGGRKGPPALPLRLLGPLVLLTSLAVIGTGVVLGYAGRDVGWWLFAHKAVFVLWFAVMTIHVLAYAWRLPRLIAGDLRSSAAYRARDVLAGRRARWLLLTASVPTGLLLGVLTFHQAGAWLGSDMVGAG